MFAQNDLDPRTSVKQAEEKVTAAHSPEVVKLHLGSKAPINKFFAPEKKIQTVFAIIDMQPRFIASKKSVLTQAFVKALKNAISKNHYILFINYDPQSKFCVDGQWIDVPVDERRAKA